MDKKIRNRILYASVALLWAVAIYRTVQNYEVKEENSTTENITAIPPVSPGQFNKDTFVLELPTRDPFLSAGWTASTTTSVRVTGSEQDKEIQKDPVQPITKKWPEIQYLGFVKNRNKNSTLSLVKIDGHLMQLDKGETYEGIVVSHVFADSILLAMDHDKKTFRKQTVR